MHAVGLVVAITLLAAPAAAVAQDRTRVDLYDTQGRREGYAVIDRDSGRVDLYDRDSRRTGYGRIQPDGKVDLYDPRGGRRGVVQPTPAWGERKR
jgi:hypothetical protein